MSISRSAIRQLPLFMAYCPDLPNVLAQRLSVRGEHLARWSKDKESGRGFFGLGIKPPPGSTPQLVPSTPSAPQLAGSLMIFHSDSLETAWERIKEDVYYTAGVWDKGQIVVNEFTQPPPGSLYPL